jgi:hypothetical protein
MVSVVLAVLVKFTFNELDPDVTNPPPVAVNVRL